MGVITFDETLAASNLIITPQLTSLLYGKWKYLVSGLFVPQTIRMVVPWTIRTMGRLFVPWTIRTMDYSYVGLFVRWTFRG